MLEAAILLLMYPINILYYFCENTNS
jgi:hypothetical protein